MWRTFLRGGMLNQTDAATEARSVGTPNKRRFVVFLKWLRQALLVIVIAVQPG